MNTQAASATEVLPDLSGSYDLAAEQVAAYQRDGHILLRAVASPEEVAAYRSGIVDTTLSHNTQGALEERDTYGKAFIQIGNLLAKNETARRFVLARRFAKIAAELMGVPAVRLYHDQALFKEAGGGFTPWHQDQHYWPLDTDKTITMWMPLVDASEAMGTMRFASGSQGLGYLGDLPISDESQQEFENFIAQRGLSITSSGGMKAGDATFHSGWTLHGAAGNTSSTMREVMTIIYFADGARISQPDNTNREYDLKNWFPGCAPGDLAASPLNPIVYSETAP